MIIKKYDPAGSYFSKEIRAWNTGKALVGHTFRDPSLLRAAFTQLLRQRAMRGTHLQQRAAGVFGRRRAGLRHRRKHLYKKRTPTCRRGGDLTRLRAALVWEGKSARGGSGAGPGRSPLSGQGREERRRGGKDALHFGRCHGVRVCRRVIWTAAWTPHGADPPGAAGQGAEELVEERRRDYKTELQELVQRRNDQVLRYELAGRPARITPRSSRSASRSTARRWARAQAAARSEAEQSAACAALAYLKNQ